MAEEESEQPSEQQEQPQETEEQPEEAEQEPAQEEQPGAEPDAETTEQPPTEPETEATHSEIDTTSSEAQEQSVPEQVPVEQPQEQYAEQPEEIILPPDVAELEAIMDQLATLHKAATKANDALHDMQQQETTQRTLKSYSNALAHLPEVLQKLNDYRRHFQQIAKHAEQVRARLVKIRGAEDALSSEEVRVIVTTASVKDVILGLIQQLEDTFTHIRGSTRVLLQIISYHEPGFDEFTKKSLSILNVHTVHETFEQTLDIATRFRDDMQALHELDAHAQELQG